MVQRQGLVIQTVGLPLLLQVLVFGNSLVTTSVIRACLKREVPIAYLSRMGYCYGRLMPVTVGYRQLGRYQQALSLGDRLLVARALVRAKVRNGRVVLMRQRQRINDSGGLAGVIEQLGYWMERVGRAESMADGRSLTIAQLRGMEGMAAMLYFRGLEMCLEGSGFVFAGRSRQPPGNPVNAMLSFGYQVVWNHLLSLVELAGLDAYEGCLHEGHRGHAALVSDLLEPFRAPLVDGLVLYLVHRGLVQADRDFEYRDGGCFLNEGGRRIFLRALMVRMEERVGDGGMPKWDLLGQAVQGFKRFVYAPGGGYEPYTIR